MDVLSAVKMDRAVRHIDLLDFIITQDAHVLRTNESQLLKKAAEQPASYALELLHASGVALHPYETASGRGWQARDCPFRAAIACRRDQNVRRLLELGAKPGPELLADLSSLPVEAQWAFANHGYWL